MKVSFHIHDRGRVKSFDAFTQKEIDDLVERLTSIIDGQQTQDDQEGHVFHGNQYVEVPVGPKPTSHTAKSVRAGVAQLLASGHSFSKEDLMKATGAKLEQQVANALWELRKTTPPGGLVIVKVGSEYKLQKQTQVPAPPPAPGPKPPVAAPPPPPPEPPKAPEPAPTPTPAPKAPPTPVPEAPRAPGATVKNGVESWTPMKNAKTAAALARTLGYVKHVDFGKMSPEIINAHMSSLGDHLQEFPRLKDRQDFAGSAQQYSKWLQERRKVQVREVFIKRYPHFQPPRTAAAEEQLNSWVERFAGKKLKAPGRAWAVAYSSPGQSAVCFNEKYAKGTGNEELQRSLKYSMQTKFHPPGCDTVKSIADHEYGHQLDYLLGLRNHPELKRIVAETSGNMLSHRKANIQEALSTYAATNDAEFIAEAWAESKNNPNPRPVAQKVAALIRSEYAKKFGTA